MSRDYEYYDKFGNEVFTGVEMVEGIDELYDKDGYLITVYEKQPLYNKEEDIL